MPTDSKAAAALAAVSGGASAPSSGAAPPSTSNMKPLQVKLVLLGEAAVGKSSLVLRFVNDEFQENKEPTIGAAFLAQKCRLEDKVIKFEIWDTAGQERFHSLAPMYYRNAQAAIVVYDVTKESSLDKAKAWVKELQRQANPNIVIALAGNKCDLVSPELNEDAEDDADPESSGGESPTSPTHGRQVSVTEGQSYAEEAGLIFFETSAKTGANVVEVFTEIGKKIPIEQPQASNRSRVGGGQGLNSGNVRIDLLREGGGVNGFGSFGDNRGRSSGSGESSCAC